MTDIEPTLNDDGVMDFIATGYIVLEGLIEDDFNRCCLQQPGGNADGFIGGEDLGIRRGRLRDLAGKA